MFVAIVLWGRMVKNLSAISISLDQCFASWDIVSLIIHELHVYGCQWVPWCLMPLCLQWDPREGDKSGRHRCKMKCRLMVIPWNWPDFLKSGPLSLLGHWAHWDFRVEVQRCWLDKDDLLPQGDGRHILREKNNLLLSRSCYCKSYYCCFSGKIIWSYAMYKNKWNRLTKHLIWTLQFRKRLKRKLFLKYICIISLPFMIIWMLLFFKNH